MNNKKICFISCVNDQIQYSESKKYIESLIVPQGYSIDFISITNAKSITEGYNRAMNSSDAKYKVYLHQDTYIINKNFINDILEIFEEKNIGMIGVAGSKTIPTNGVWWEAAHKFGKVYESHTDKMKLLAFNDVLSKYEEVKAIDGLIMITQYDIKWREDIFDGWHLYDASQSVEFTLKSYKVIVPKQTESWCIHDCGFVENNEVYDAYRNKFLDEYSKKIFPLVSILIPAYNRPDYLKEALESAINQTYRNIEIIICDDSTDDRVMRMIEKYFKINNNVKYIKNAGVNDALKNFDKCLSISNGEYINYLMDDDIFSVAKIEKMMNYYLDYANVKLVTSARKVIDENGLLKEDINATKSLFAKDVVINGDDLGNYVLASRLNKIGEPTTVLFKKSDIPKDFGMYHSKRYYYNVDIAAWLTLLSKGDAVYISEPLSYFRLHKGQNQNKSNAILKGQLEWYDLIMDSYDNFIKDKVLSRQILYKWIEDATYFIRQYDKSDVEYISKLYIYIDNVLRELLSLKRSE